MLIDKQNIKKIVDGQTGEEVASNILYNFNLLSDAINNSSGGSHIIKKNNISASAWSENSPYLSYKYGCDIPVEDITSNDYAEVVFDVAEAISGNYAPVCTTSNGKVTIYSSVNKKIIIPTIIIYK